MLRLIKKFSWPFIFYPVLLIAFAFPLFNHDRITGPNPLTLNFVFTLAPYLYYIVIGAIWTHEQIEFRSKGYSFLKLLPIKERDIVAAKFLLVYLSVLIFVVFHIFAFAGISKDPNFFDPSRSYLVLNGVLCLVLSAFLYLLIFKFRFDKVMKYLTIIWIVILAAPLILVILVLPRVGLTRTEIIMFSTKINWILMGVIGTIVYFWLMQLAVRIKRKSQY